MQASLQTVKAELERLSRQQQLLGENEFAGQLFDADIKKLDASVKRNTSLIKKLRNITEDNAASLLEEIARTMQSKVHPHAVNPLTLPSGEAHCKVSGKPKSIETELQC